MMISAATTVWQYSPSHVVITGDLHASRAAFAWDFAGQIADGRPCVEILHPEEVSGEGVFLLFGLPQEADYDHTSMARAMLDHDPVVSTIIVETNSEQPRLYAHGALRIYVERLSTQAEAHLIQAETGCNPISAMTIATLLDRVRQTTWQSQVAPITTRHGIMVANLARQLAATGAQLDDFVKIVEILVVRSEGGKTVLRNNAGKLQRVLDVERVGIHG